MKQNKQDRRSQRTRQLVNAALMGLLSEKRYDEITVQDIIDRAGIGRTTFYSHYFDKEDVHTSILEGMLERMSQQISQSESGQEILPSLELFQHIYQSRQHFQAVAGGPSGERLWETMQTLLGKTIEQSLQNVQDRRVPPIIPLTVMSSYLAGAFLNLLKWWLKIKMPYTPEEMNQVFQQLAMPGVWAVLHSKNT